MSNPTLEQWQKLYEASIAIKQLAPWQWMLETDIFAVQDTQTKEFNFVSVMGNLGEHFSIAVYMGAKAVHQFWNLTYNASNSLPLQGILEVYNLQASFEDRTELEKEDRQVMKDLNLKFRGRQAYPLFRSYQPARVPWFITADEARILLTALEQTLLVAPTLQEDPTCFDEYDEEHFLVRVLTDQGWQDEEHHIPPPAKITKLPQIDKPLMQEFKKLETTAFNLEIDLFLMFSSPVQDDKNIRPYFPYIMIAFAPEVEQIVIGDLFAPLPTIEDMYHQFPSELIRRLVAIELRPAQIKLQSEHLYSLLKPLESQLGIQIVFQPVLPDLNEIFLQMLDFDPPH